MKDSVLKKYIKFLNWVYIFPILILYVTIIITNDYQSEFKGFTVKLTVVEISILLALLLFGYMLLRYIFLYILKKKSSLKIEINYKKLDKFFLLVVICQLLFFFETGNGKLFLKQTSKFSAIANSFDLKIFFIYYYFISYRKTKIFYFNVGLYLLLEILRGWTGYIFNIFLYEIYFFMLRHKKFNCFIAYPFILLLGGKLYEYFYSLKYKIRLGIHININYKEALIKLVERLTYFPHFLVGIQNSNKILELYNIQGIKLIEVKAFFRPSTPSFLYDKSFRSFNNLLMKSVYETLDNSTSASMGFFSFFYNLLKTNFIEVSTYIILLFFIFFIIIKISQVLNNLEEKNIGSVILYIFLLKFYNSGGLESSFYGFMILFNFIYFLLLFKIVRMKKGKIK